MITSILPTERLPKLVKLMMWSRVPRLVNQIPAPALETARLSLENIAWSLAHSLRVIQLWRATTQQHLFI